MKSFIIALAMVFMYFLAFVAFEWLIGIIFAAGAVTRCIGAIVCTGALLIAQCITYVEMESK